jgi:hypothetical protein
VYLNGLGDMSDLPTMWPFGTIDCSNPMLWAVFVAKCAKYSPEAWGQIAGFTNPFGSGTVAGVPAIAGAYDSAALAKMTPEEVQAQVDAALAQQVTDTQSNAAAAVKAQGVSIPETDCGLFKTSQEQSDGAYVCGLNYLLIGAVAAASIGVLVVFRGQR